MSVPDRPITVPDGSISIPDGDFGLTGSLSRVLADIADERIAQDVMWGIDEHPDGTGPHRSADADRAKREVADSASRGTLTWRHILLEEVLEAFAEDDPDALRAELVQVAAVATKWIQALDRRRSHHPADGLPE
ncbi:hypothetical protein [Sphaerisporangium fuscum]|uniref:hypothetical protein n=1 Tax=Sphaerisporangium fuscum TaxID=2835868 RepID=UPI001BDD501F|nr:hypothetical protein [Sphaerisporangium fuscum]